MGNIRIVKMRFDLSNEYDAATYQRLAESAKRGERSNRGMQASFLASVMLGVRPYGGLRNAGLTEHPQLDPDSDEWMARQLFVRQHRAPILRLVPSRPSQNENGHGDFQ